MKKMERMQRLATRMIPRFKEKNYKERQMRLELTTLEEGTNDGMIITYKIVNGIDILNRGDENGSKQSPERTHKRANKKYLFK